MAVEAHHLPLFQSQIQRNREAIDAAGAEDLYGVYNHHQKSINTRKRSRNPNPLIGEDTQQQQQQQMHEIDRLILHHAEKVKAEVADRQRRIWAAVEEGVSKRLRSKEEEIESVMKANWAMEERVKRLCLENQIWREMARSSEAAANLLRAELEQALSAAAVKVSGEEAAAEDAESCCCGGDGEGEAEERKGICRRCGEREAAVLLLPCRHLCLCAACGPTVDECPVCECRSTCSVLVNIV